MPTTAERTHHGAMAPAQTAEVHRCNLANVVLSLKRMRLTASLHQVEWLAISRDLP